MERIEVETDWFDEPAPSGSKRQNYVTYVEREDYLVNHIRAYIRMQESGRPYGTPYLRGYPTLTVHRCWDGYSEYTVTSVWDEVEVVWDGYRHYFESTAEFLAALAAVEPVSG